MATDTTHTYPERRFPLFGLPRLVPGLALTGALTALAVWAGDIPGWRSWGVGALTLAILLGILVGNTLYPRKPFVTAAYSWPNSACCVWALSFTASG